MSTAPRSDDQRAQWIGWLSQQAEACGELGSELYSRLLRLIAADVASGGSTWDVLRAGGDLRFGQAGPLRLLGAAHRLALNGEAPDWADLMPSCGGRVPDADEALLVAWRALVDVHGDALVAGLGRQVQTNEVGRAAGLGLAVAESQLTETRLVELGCSAGLNLRLDHFEVDLGGVVLGDSRSPVHLRPEMARGLAGIRRDGLALGAVTERVGIDPHPIDRSTPGGALTLRSFVWPDQSERLARVEAAIELAGKHSAEILTCASADPSDSSESPGIPTASAAAAQDAADVLASVLERSGPTVVMHSIVWQYMPTDVRWRITSAIEDAGVRATAQAPLVWIRYEPDHWDRRRASIWCRRFPDGSDRLVAHADYHGRWLAPV